MNEPPKRAVRRFGWVAPDLDSKEGRLKIATCDREFSEEEWKEFGEIVGAIADNRPYIIDFLALRRNFEGVITLEKTLCAELNFSEVSSLFGGLELIKAHVTSECVISNFLAAASAFRDRARVRLIEVYGQQSTELRAFDEVVRHCYDTSFSYRLLYNLRNYAQHHASPLEMIPIRGKRSDEGRMMPTVQIELQRDALITGKKIQPRIREELANQPKGIPLNPLVREYMQLHGRIMLAIIELQQERFARFAAYARVIVEKSGMPKGATPVIWDGPPMEQVWPNISTNMHGFSLDEFALLTKLMLELRNQSA